MIAKDYQIKVLQQQIDHETNPTKLKMLLNQLQNLQSQLAYSMGYQHGYDDAHKFMPTI